MLVDAIGSEGGTFSDRRHNKAMNQARHIGLIGSNKLALASFGTRIAAWYFHKLVHPRSAGHPMTWSFTFLSCFSEN